MLQDRAGIIVLREDLDFYAIPPKAEIESTEMIEVKRAAARALLRQDGIFSGLKRSEEQGTTEQHLIEMLTAGLVTSFMSFAHFLLLLPLSPSLFLALSACHLGKHDPALFCDHPFHCLHLLTSSAVVY